MADGVPSLTRKALSERFESGSSWEAALGALCPFLNSSEFSIIAAGERTGNLASVLEELGSFRKESADFRRRIKLASIYPLAILHFGALIFPLSHLVEGNTAAYLVSVGMVLVPLWTIVFVFGLLSRLSPRFKKGIQSIVPIVRSYSINRDLSRFCRTFAACAKSGIPIAQCWEWSLDAADSGRLDKEGAEAIRAINSGNQASAAFSEKGGFPHELRQTYKMGERSGELDKNLERVAELYSNRAGKRLFQATLVYPALMLLVVAGFVVYKVFVFYMGYFDGITDLAQ